MKVPKRLTVHVVSASGESDLSDIIVVLTVTTHCKSPYYIMFPKTDGSGVAVLTRKDFLGQFTDHWESGLMDHSGTPETADSTVSVGLYDPSWSVANPERALAWPLLKHQRTKWRSRDEEYRYRTTSRNDEFGFDSVKKDLEKIIDFSLTVRRKNKTECSQ